MCIIRIMTMRSCIRMNIFEILAEYFAFSDFCKKYIFFSKSHFEKLILFISSLEYSKSD